MLFRSCRNSTGPGSPPRQISSSTRRGAEISLSACLNRLGKRNLRRLLSKSISDMPRRDAVSEDTRRLRERIANTSKAVLHSLDRRRRHRQEAGAGERGPARICLPYPSSIFSATSLLISVTRRLSHRRLWDAFNLWERLRARSRR